MRAAPAIMNAPAVNELAVEGSVYALFAEFLAGWFDGGSHAVGANVAVAFPKLFQSGTPNPVLNNLRFGQSAVPQPLKGLSITMVLSAGATRKVWESNLDLAPGVPTRQQIAYMKARFNFWVRAETAAGSDGDARKQCLNCADRLHAVLDNAAAVKPLAQKGVKRIRPQAPQPVAETSYILRLLPVTAVLRYPVLSQV